jgi:hypothetical protein
VFVGLGGLVMLPLLATIIEPARRNEAGVSGAPTRIDRFIFEHADFMIRHYVAVACYSAMIYAVLSWFLRCSFACTAGRRVRLDCATDWCC